MLELEAELRKSSFKKAGGGARQAVSNVLRRLIEPLRQIFGSKTPLNCVETPAEPDMSCYDATAGTEQPIELVPCDSQKLYLLLCVDETSTKTVLHQPKLESVNRDRELFEFMRDQCSMLIKPKRWPAMRSIKRCSLSQVQAPDESRYTANLV